MTMATHNIMHGSISAAQDDTGSSNAARLKQACSDFEAVFLDCMFKTMRNTLSGNDIFGKSLGRDIYESMYYQQLSIDIASQGKGLGIGDKLYQELYQKMVDGQSRTQSHQIHYGSL